MIGANTSRVVVGAAKQADTSLGSRFGGADDSTLWDIYESLGPVHYGLGFKRNAASRVRYYAGELFDGEVIATDNPQVVEAFDRITNFAEIVGDFLVHLNVTGEGWLVGQEKDVGEIWDVWSAEEINRDKRQLEDAVVIRVWRPSPRKRSKADSPLRSVQPQCEQLLLLNDQIGATAMSRIPAGVFMYPDELTLAKPATEDSDESSFEEDLLYAISTAIKDPQSAARVTPITIRGPGEWLDKIRHLDFGRDMDVTFANMREELLRQIAAGLDLPGEILTGLADLNHWSLWGIEETTLKHHIDPDILLVLSGLTQQYLWPALEGITDPQRFVIWRDYQDLTSRPVSPEQAQTLYRDGVINAAELRNILNIEQPDQGDIEGADVARMSEALKVLVDAGFSPEGALGALGLPAIAFSGRPAQLPSGTTDDPVPEPDRGPPMTAAQGIRLDGLADIDFALAGQIVEATEAAFARSMERAGVRIRNKVRKDRSLTALIDGVPNDRVTRTLGPSQLERYQLTQDQLLPADEFDALKRRLVQLLERAQAETEAELAETIPTATLDTVEVEVDRSTAVTNFITALFAVAALRLFSDPEPDESGEFDGAIASGQMVYDLMTQAAGGGGSAADGIPGEFDSTTANRGYALGARTRAALVDAGYVTASETWRYGFAPRQTFPPHKNLDGTQFTDPESPSLRVPAEYAWVGTTYFFPGDHKGCLCSTVPTVLPALDL